MRRSEQREGVGELILPYIFSHGLTAWWSLQDWVICCGSDSCSCLGYSSFVYFTYLSLRKLATVHSVRLYGILV